jgi:hypothetical protein
VKNPKRINENRGKRKEQRAERKIVTHLVFVSKHYSLPNYIILSVYCKPLFVAFAYQRAEQYGEWFLRKNHYIVYYTVFYDEMGKT